MRPLPIVFVTRGNLHLTKPAVRSALAQTYPSEVLLVDNASSDSTVRWAAARSLTTILTDRQWSLSRCWNTALQALWKAGHTRALVCNNDIELRPDAAEMLLAHGGDFVTCVSVDSADRLGQPGDRTIDELRLRQRPHPDFSCFLIRRSVTDRIGWFDEQMWPAYVEDSDYHVRMHRAGIEALCIDLPFLHHSAQTIKQANANEAAIIRRGADANRLRFKSKYGCLPGSVAYQRLFA